MSAILVTPLSAVSETMRRYQPSHLITLLSPDFMIETPEGFAPERHLRLSLNDIVEAEPGRVPPHEDHIAQIMEFSRTWDARQPLLVHCWAGVSRSMASAFAILCERAPRGSEFRIAQEIRERAPHANPNRLIVRLADAYLGREGAMVEAVDRMDAAVFVEEGTVVEFPLVDFGL
jgi:predicted protein tyrosine phosphatase